jgi:hypothetical protein
MKETDKLYVVVYVRGGRMYTCDCHFKHHTPEAAHECVKKRNGISIMEWVKDRSPQFQEYWRSPELEQEEN